MKAWNDADIAFFVEVFMSRMKNNHNRDYQTFKLGFPDYIEWLEAGGVKVNRSTKVINQEKTLFEIVAPIMRARRQSELSSLKTKETK